MHELQSLYHLVDNVPVVGIFQYFLADGIMQIGLHVLKHEVQVLFVIGFHDAIQFYDVGVIELMEKDNFSVSSLCIGRVLEGVEYFLEGEDFT